MSKFCKILLLAALSAVVAGTLYFFWDSFFNIYKSNLEKIEKTDFSKIIKEVKKEILSPPPLNVGGAEMQTILTKAKIIAQTNIQRYDNGLLPPLVENAKLSEAAMAKANDMFLRQYFEHVSPLGIGPAELVENYGYDYIVTGENLILGNFRDEKELVQLWMDSPGHRANILNNRFTEIGVAVVRGDYKGQTVWIGVQEFGLPLSACEQPSQDIKNQIDFNQRQLDRLSLQIYEKKSEIDNTNQKSQKYNQLADEHNRLVQEHNILVQQTKNIILQYNNQVNAFNQCVTGE